MARRQELMSFPGGLPLTGEEGEEAQRTRVARRQELMSFPGGLPLTGLVGLCAVRGSSEEIPP